MKHLSKHMEEPIYNELNILQKGPSLRKSIGISQDLMRISVVSKGLKSQLSHLYWIPRGIYFTCTWVYQNKYDFWWSLYLILVISQLLKRWDSNRPHERTLRIFQSKFHTGITFRFKYFLNVWSGRAHC